MAVTYRLLESFDGTREFSIPDPENEGETLTHTMTNVKDIEVEFSSSEPSVTHTRFVNVVFDSEGNYDADATAERISAVAQGVQHKIEIGIIS